MDQANLIAAPEDALLELGRSLVLKRECDDVSWAKPTRLAVNQQPGDPSRDNLGLSSACAGDELEVAPVVADCIELRFGQRCQARGSRYSMS